MGLYHRADCVECGIESDRFSLGGLHVGVIHRVLERRLAVGALVANVAIELDLRTCPGKENGRDKINTETTKTRKHGTTTTKK